MNIITGFSIFLLRSISSIGTLYQVNKSHQDTKNLTYPANPPYHISYNKVIDRVIQAQFLSSCLENKEFSNGYQKTVIRVFQYAESNSDVKSTKKRVLDTVSVPNFFSPRFSNFIFRCPTRVEAALSGRFKISRPFRSH